MTSSRTGTAGLHPPALHAFRPILLVSRQSHGKAIRGTPAGCQVLSPGARTYLPPHRGNHGHQRASS
eukprot:436634-Amphidinium_carterae.1